MSLANFQIICLALIGVPCWFIASITGNYVFKPGFGGVVPYIIAMAFPVFNSLHGTTRAVILRKKWWLIRAIVWLLIPVACFLLYWKLATFNEPVGVLVLVLAPNFGRAVLVAFGVIGLKNRDEKIVPSGLFFERFPWHKKDKGQYFMRSLYQPKSGGGYISLCSIVELREDGQLVRDFSGNKEMESGAGHYLLTRIGGFDETDSRQDELEYIRQTVREINMTNPNSEFSFQGRRLTWKILNVVLTT